MNDKNSIIKISEGAVKEIKNLAASQNTPRDKMKIRIGVKQGGCSGLSYFMKIDNSNNIECSDEVLDYEDFCLICDSKSLLYIYGMLLDYEASLIGGGFKFTNPNATQTCGCGKSFSL